MPKAVRFILPQTSYRGTLARVHFLQCFLLFNSIGILLPPPASYIFISVCMHVSVCVFVCQQHDNLKISNVLIPKFVGLMDIAQGQTG
jgi:hypothetical protein